MRLKILVLNSIIVLHHAVWDSSERRSPGFLEVVWRTNPFTCEGMVPQATLEEGKGKPGNHCLHMCQIQYVNNILAYLACHVLLVRVGTYACSSYQDLFVPSPKRAWGRG